MASRCRFADWSVRHAAAVATGALLSRGVLAFFCYPVVGETTAVRKYAHNVTMLAIVVALGWLALGRRDLDSPPSRR
jgi:hypothetical protein